MITALLLLSSALAARHEISADTGATATTDGVAWEWFNQGMNAPQPGLRAGYAVLRDRQHFGVVVGGSWNRSSQGTYGAYSEEDGMLIRDRLVVDRFGVNAKADYDVGGVFFPYLRAEARLLTAAARLDSEVSGGVYQTFHGVTGGGMGTAGFELMVPDEKLHMPVTVAVYMEAGYEGTANVKLGDLGSINLSGAVVRGGIGLRW